MIKIIRIKKNNSDYNINIGNGVGGMSIGQSLSRCYHWAQMATEDKYRRKILILKYLNQELFQISILNQNHIMSLEKI